MLLRFPLPTFEGRWGEGEPRCDRCRAATNNVKLGAKRRTRCAQPERGSMTADARQRYPQAAYVDPSARVYGQVEIGEGASLWPCSVIRSEGFHVKIGRFTNLQDH